MEFFSKLFENQVSLYNMLQIGADLLMFALLAVVMVAKKPRISKKDQDVMKSFEKILEETDEISRRFEINLQQRQELLQQITAKLDQRIEEAQGLCMRLERLSRTDPEQPPIQHSSSTVVRLQGAIQQRVMSLAKKGLGASEIAKSLKRPVGEIELILNLQKISE